MAGGDWCKWCHVLNGFIHANADLKAQLQATFVVLKVYIGADNFNEKFFARLPPTDSAPHFWVMSATGEVLASQRTDEFEGAADSYEKQKLLAFIDNWHSRLPK